LRPDVPLDNSENRLTLAAAGAADAAAGAAAGAAAAAAGLAAAGAAEAAVLQMRREGSETCVCTWRP
jgi:hypothetical protein